MKEEKYILSIDQGTTSSRAVLFDKEQNIVCIEQKEIKQYYPFKGWVEQSPEEIWQTSYESALKILEKRKLTSNEIAAIGITNQRETTIVWDKKTGKPLHRAIVWQDTRTAKYCEDIKHSSYFNIIKRKTGLLVDSYFSATKIKWILDKYDKNRERSKKGELLFGTIDTWLLWKLTNGELHYTDYSNASRTMLFDINKKDWSNELLDFFNIPKEILPKIKDTSEVYGYTGKNTFEHRIPVSSLVGDQQAALFGHQCVNEGMVKNTYGTGCFMLMNTGRKVVKSNHGLLSTIAWHFNGQTTYALEGSVFVAGAVIQWLRDQMGLINHSSESEILATKVDDNNGVYFVPAFTGLGAPHWDGSTQGAIIGLTRDSNKYHIVRAALESMAYQTKDVLYSMVTDSNIDLNKIYVDGGAVDNNFLMQFQSDILNADIIRTEKKESTALGSALLAGLAVGYYSKHDISDNKSINKIFKPEIDNKLRTKFYTGWLQAVDRVKNI